MADSQYIIWASFAIGGGAGWEGRKMFGEDAHAAMYTMVTLPLHIQSGRAGGGLKRAGGELKRAGVG